MTGSPQPLATRWRHWYRRCLPAYWISLFLVTHLPGLTLGAAPPQSDKVLHVAAFGLLAFLVWRFRQTFAAPIGPRFAPLAGVGLILYASVDEYLQQFVRRGTDLEDWAADVAGVGLVLLGLELWRRRGEKNRKNSDDS
jgi:VanZ family protein